MGTYRKDKLTRKVPGGNWHIQFRVPERLRGRHPFIGKEVFCRSLGTKSHSEAIALKERFLHANGYYDDELDRQEVAYVRRTKAEDHYWQEHHSIQNKTDSDLRQYASDLDDIKFEYMDVDPDGKSSSNQPYVNMLTAKIQAVETVIRERSLKPFEADLIEHPFKRSLSRICTEYEFHYNALNRQAKSTAKIESARKRFCEFMGYPDIAAENIKRANVFKFINYKRTAGASRSTTQNDLSYLSSAFSHAQNSGVVPAHLNNPFSGHALRDFVKATKRAIFSEEQLRSICQLISADKELTAYIYVGYYTGMRLSEIFDARIIKTKAGFAFSVAEDNSGKTAAATRIIPLHTDLVQYLPRLGFPISVDARLPWSSSGDMAIGKRFGRAKAKSLRAAGILDHRSLVFHSLRHGFSTALSNAGFTELHITDLTGHEKEGKAISEAGRSYIASVPLEKLCSMIEAIPSIFSPDEIW